MRYNAPPGDDADAPFLDGNRNAGIRGSVVPAAAVEHPQRELAHLISFSGQTPASDDLEQVRKAIETLISAATGGGDTSQFLLVSQARVRLPIFPEILSADGRMIVTSPAAGTILVPPTVAFQHRGIYPLSTSDYSEPNRTFATSASKTYHVRWDPTNGFRLRDLADPTYNPGVLAETSSVFDSTYDDMLVARVVTSGANVSTIVNLINSNRLFYRSVTGRITSGVVVNNNSYGTSTLLRAGNSFVYNFARTPQLDSINAIMGASNPGMTSPYIVGIHGVANAIFNKDATRYGTSFDILTDYTGFGVPSGGYVEIDFRTMG